MVSHIGSPSVNLYSVVAFFAVLLSACILLQASQTEAYSPRRIAIMRRDGMGDFDSLLSELKSKGSRMRFGKRSTRVNSRSAESAVPQIYDLSPEASNTDSSMNFYTPDRYLWFQ
ncbi:hypothetical protein Ddc_08192 [Ditylenchus destructor]|nr:hypothetical protein Ddc_08192 [Ditylenchus destructor]